ncbi:RDD family protein [Rhizobiales bacterium TNE-4]|nr:RDD family protein [Rhizobiales bacterium TNE-4]MBV1827369.1 RDD family protein [Rhizobiales bacterium TNE-4]
MSLETSSYPTPAPIAPNVAGVLAGRTIGFFVDLILIGILCCLIFFLLVIPLGLVTGGLLWFLLPPLFPIVAFLYNGFTISGRKQATPGMRLFGVRLQMAESGGEVSFLIAAVHAIFYYVSVSFLTPFILLVGVFRSDSRMLHDLLAGVIAVRRG